MELFIGVGMMVKYMIVLNDNTISGYDYLSAILFLKGNNFTLDNSSFINNMMGSMYIYDSVNVTIVNCNFTNNSRRNIHLF